MGEGHDERRIVTALFADVAGSTALSERLDPEEAKLIIGEAISRAIQAVEAYGGTVNNLMGDGLLALFGAPVAHEDDPERAVRAGLDILSGSRSYAEEVRRGWGVEGFAMRLGIHTGEVVVGPTGGGGRIEYGVMGDTINTAARLEAAAESEGMLVSETTQRQVAARFHWGDVRVLSLKGKAEPVTAYPVIGLREAAGAEQPAAPMVGRNRELGAGIELLDRLASGRGAVLFIVGEPGIGKTRLAGELRQRATSQHRYTWLEGRCVSYGESLPYWPYRDLLRNWLEASATEPELRLRVKLRRKTEEAFPGRGAETYPYLATVLGVNLEPAAAEQVKELSPESLQFRTFEVLTELIGKLASVGPVVLSLDDLHWADATSLALTERLLALTESSPLLVAISQRPETEHASWTLKEKAAREYRHLFSELSLNPLAIESETALLSSLVGNRALPPLVVEQLLAYAEGNPFYLEQLLRSLIDSGVLVPENSHWRLKSDERLEIPQTLEGVIIARIDRLDPEWREALTCSSVLGRTFGLELIEAVSGFELPVVREAVHHLLRLDLLREEGGGSRPVYRFKHALIQEAAYHTLVGPKRAALHQRAAVWYEGYYKDRLERVYGLIAHHWLATDDHEKAARFLKLAGDRALAEWALDEAVEQYRALIPLLQEAGRRQDAAETLFQVAATLHLAMRYREANETWQRAFTDWTPPRRLASRGRAAFRIATNTAPWVTDPAHANHAANTMLHNQLYRRLLAGRPGPYVVPELAHRWQVSDDGRSYRFELDPNARWNDGGALTAADVVEGCRIVLDPAVGSSESAHLSALVNAEAYATGQIGDFSQVGVRAIGDHTLEFRLQSPAPYWVFVLVGAAPSGARAGRVSGPFRVARLESGRAVVERDPGHQGGWLGNVAQVEWRTRGDMDVLAALEKGQIDLVAPYNPPQLMEILSSGRVRAAVGAPLMAGMVCFSGGPPHVVDIHLRRALSYATDRRLIEPYLFANQRAATGGIVPPGLLGHTPDTVLPFDPDRARESLRQSRHSGPLQLAISTTWVIPWWEPLLQSWRDVLGIEIESVWLSIEQFDRPTDYVPAYLHWWITGYPDPGYFLQVLFHSKSRSNFSRWSSPEIDALLDRAAGEASSPARLALFHEADRALVQRECAVLPLIYSQYAAIHQPWVRGWWTWGVSWQSFDEIEIDDRSPRFHGLD